MHSYIEDTRPTIDFHWGTISVTDLPPPYEWFIGSHTWEKWPWELPYPDMATPNGNVLDFWIAIRNQEHVYVWLSNHGEANRNFYRGPDIEVFTRDLATTITLMQLT